MDTVVKLRDWLGRRAENILALVLASLFVSFLIQIVFRYVLNLPLDPGDLATESAQWVEQVDELVADDRALALQVGDAGLVEHDAVDGQLLGRCAAGGCADGDGGGERQQTWRHVVTG